MSKNHYILLTLSLMLLLSSCTHKDNTIILKGHNFNPGNWLLVNEDNAQGTFKMIDDETVLSQNPTGIKVNWLDEHGFTTCDGIHRLYKDGELVAQKEYLDKYYLIESTEIKAAYKNGSDGSVNPDNKLDYERLWDSLTKIKNCYPTRYFAQPENKNIIWFYKHE